MAPAAAVAGRAADLAALPGFRAGLYRCFTARADEQFELCDAVLCTDGPVKTLAGLSLAAEHWLRTARRESRSSPRGARSATGRSAQ